ncbi:cubilin-like isoform X1 [Penaeus chinensis]|uniref:cubilin-like isoform X1 n=1 Tax=Penaeus chinensis TaxID=139456 RepID=UPI001FB5AC86|nr:cubilin-like isoform X1 [Penaeus chinensis]
MFGGAVLLAAVCVAFTQGEANPPGPGEPYLRQESISILKRREQKEFYYLPSQESVFTHNVLDFASTSHPGTSAQPSKETTNGPTSTDTTNTLPPATTSTDQLATTLDAQSSTPYTNCGAVVNGEVAGEGVIATPGYPEQYANGLYCVWTILAGKGKRVRLNFEDFEVTRTPGCSGDYLFVSPTGLSNDTSARHMCGTDTPGEFVSEKDVLYVEFRSSPDGDTCRGFSARYTLEEVVVTCGDTISFLEFDFENPEYPAPTRNLSSHCELTISHDCEIPICQVRLDFHELELQPPEYGNCDSDQFMVRANEPVPILCGSNNGQHLYVDVAGRASTSLHVLTSEIFPKPVGHMDDPVTGNTIPREWRYEVEDNRRWKVRVNQIPCDCTYDHLKTSTPRAPTGCLQYHVGIRETIKSLNFEGTKLDYNPCWNGTELDCGRRVWTGHLNNLDYHVCVRGAEGYCGIMYSPTGPESFFLTGQTSFNYSGETANLFGTKDCQADYIVVAKSRTPGDNDPWSHDRFCGQDIGNYVKGPIVSYSTPFYMQVKTDADEFSRSIDIENRGFELEYTQLPCSGPYLFNTDQKYRG